MSQSESELKLQEMQRAINHLSKVVLRDAHEATKDLRETIKEAKEMQKEITDQILTEISENLEKWFTPVANDLCDRTAKIAEDKVKEAIERIQAVSVVVMKKAIEEIRKRQMAQLEGDLHTFQFPPQGKTV